MEDKIEFKPDCPGIGSCIHDEDLLLHDKQPVCEYCGIPYYFAYLSGDWVHPFEKDGEIIGWY